MAKKLSEEGIEYVDGEPVSLYDGKFMGSFLMENWDAAPISNGDSIVFLVTARTEDPKFTHVRKTGELKRTNPFRVEEIITLDPDVATVIYDAIEAAPDTTPPIVIDDDELTSNEEKAAAHFEFVTNDDLFDFTSLGDEV